MINRRDFLRLSTLGTLGATAFTGCSAAPSKTSTTLPLAATTPPPVTPSAPLTRVGLGIDVLEAQGFASLKGVRCGLVTHRAGVNGAGLRTVDVLAHAPGVRLAKLFGPEHGIDGTAAAEVVIKNAKDARTGLPVYSLYGATRRPTTEMLDGLDAIVIDFQDIGSRSYTYISCMRYVIEACWSLDRPIRVIILDRPNPIGGEKVDGAMLDYKWRSYVGAYVMPYVHGLTIGEIARWAAATPGVLELDEAKQKRGVLEVIPMQGWRRSMTWDKTGLNWVPTSPRIPTPQAALGYAMVGLGCMVGEFSHSFGEQFPFRFVKYSRRKSVDLVAALGNAVPGLVLEARTMTDGTQGVYVGVSDWAKLHPTALSYYMMRQACLWETPNPFTQVSKNDRDLFIKHAGSEALFEELRTRGGNIDLARWFAQWQTDAENFRARTAPYRIYA
jgi:uncharacterized protein YbbC (DUF1343 family)